MGKSAGNAGGEALRSQLFNLLAAAKDGRPGLEWCREVVGRAGWAPVVDGKGAAVALVSFQALVAGLPVSAATLRRWIRDGLPVYEQGLGNRPSRFDLFAVMKWREKSLEKTAAPTASETKEAEAAVLRARAKKLELQNEAFENQFVRRAWIKQEAEILTGRFRGQMASVLRQAGPELRRQLEEGIDRWEAEMKALEKDGPGAGPSA